jgi:hypothetical protein
MPYASHSLVPTRYFPHENGNILNHHHHNGVDELFEQRAAGFPLKVVVMMICLVIVVPLSLGSCSCPVQEDEIINELEKQCYEEYAEMGCTDSKTEKTFRVKKECERLKDCMENPQLFLNPSKPRILEELMKNGQNLFEFFQENFYLIFIIVGLKFLGK